MKHFDINDDDELIFYNREGNETEAPRLVKLLIKEFSNSKDTTLAEQLAPCIISEVDGRLKLSNYTNDSIFALDLFIYGAEKAIELIEE